MLLVLVGNATSSTSLVTEQEGLTWLHASTRARTHTLAAGTHVRNTYVRRARWHDARRDGARRKPYDEESIVSRIKTAQVRRGILRKARFRCPRRDEYRRAKFDDFREGGRRLDSAISSACQRLVAFLT